MPFADSAQQHPALSGAAPSPSTGLIGRGGLFNGSSQYLNAGPINLGNAFTLSAWVKIDSAATTIQTIWANKTGGFNADGFALFVDSYLTADQKLILETGNGTAGSAAATGTGAVSFGQWHRITAVVDRSVGDAHLYVDGADLTQANSIRTDFQNQSAVNLARFTNGSFYFKGVLDETRIESTARSSNWVWASYMTVASNAAFATYSSVTRQSPALSIANTGSALSLNWPASGTGFALYTATNLNAPTVWTLASNQPVLQNGQWQVALAPTSNDTRFFRLQSQ